MMHKPDRQSPKLSHLNGADSMEKIVDHDEHHDLGVYLLPLMTGVHVGDGEHTVLPICGRTPGY